MSVLNQTTGVTVCHPAVYLQLQGEQRGRDRGAVDGSAGPCGRQAGRVVAVQVGQEEQAGVRTPADLPEVHGQRGVRDHMAVHRHCTEPPTRLKTQKEGASFL